MSTKRPKVNVKFENVPSYSITGFFGGINPNEGSISFFQDNLIPGEGERPGQIVLDSIEQTFVVNLKMNPVVFKRLANWMANQLKQFEERFGEIKIDQRQLEQDSKSPPFYG
ncbi:MAG: hypothetical protein ACFFAJ_04990 [Candidatus Hodarchaeota archaeon]